MITLRFMNRYIDNPDDAIDTLTILRTMTDTDENIRQLIGQMGGIEMAVKAMKNFSLDHEGVATSGCGLLMNFCSSSFL
jgi:hypothetical protein